MIGDADRRISKLYGTLWPVLRRNQRVTFVINGDGIIVAKLRYELDIARHVNEVLDVLAAMPKPA